MYTQVSKPPLIPPCKGGRLEIRSLPFARGRLEIRSLPFARGGLEIRSLPFARGGLEIRSLPFARGGLGRGYFWDLRNYFTCVYTVAPAGEGAGG